MTERSGPDPEGDASAFVVLSVLAGLSVSDIGKSVAWYSRFLGRGPDLEPVEGVAEWVLAAGATLQLVERPGSAGDSFTRLEVADLDEAVRLLRDRGFSPADAGSFEGVVRYADDADPSGNEVSVVEALFEVTRFRVLPPAT